MLDSDPFVQGEFTYNAQQSVFVHLLCSNFNVGSSSYFGKGEYFKTDSLSALGFQDISFDDTTTDDVYAQTQADYCNPKAFSNDCDLSSNLPKILNAILNDYVNMKQPQLYGMTSDFAGKDEIMIEQVNSFSHAYFSPELDICNNKERDYSKTCKIFK